MFLDNMFVGIFWLVVLYFLYFDKVKLAIRDSRKKRIIYVAIALVILFYAQMFLTAKKDVAETSDELNQIYALMTSTTLQLKQSIAENETCFNDESLESGISADCVINIRKIQDNFRNDEKTNMSRLEGYYQANQATLNTGNQQMIEKYLKLYRAGAYSSLMGAYDQYFSAYIEWHKYFRDYVGIKGVDNMTTEEIMKAQTLAKDVVTAEEDLKLKTNAFKDYLYENFDQSFISAVQAAS
ncbi:MAG: hypothetical protein WC178_04510 [Candidatus Paceibacterota bacterium]|jgi:hypothetical protein